MKNAALLEEKFRPRNLNDTRYATRLLLNELRRWYPEDGKKHVFARPGPLTDRLRRAWGLQSLKKTLEPDGEKRKSDDRHHALDALIVAATSESALMKLTKAFQDAEMKGAHRDFADLTPPWPGFIQETKEKFPEIFVSRADRRRARGKAHDVTIRRVEEHDGASVVYERKSVDKLTEKDLERIKDPERNEALIASLRAWINAGKPKDRPPEWRLGGKNKDGIEKEPERIVPIRKVYLKTGNKPGVLVHDGAADRGEMTRMDVFRKRNRKGIWEFFIIPIYPHQVANSEQWPAPPNRVVRSGKDEKDWNVIDGSYEFLWSLYSFSLVEIVKSDGEVIQGYMRSLDRSTGALTISPHHTKAETRKGIGIRTLKSFRKFEIDRLGRRFEVEREIRTWRGAAYI